VVDRAPTDNRAIHVRAHHYAVRWEPPSPEMFQRLMGPHGMLARCCCLHDTPHWQFDGDAVLPEGTVAGTGAKDHDRQPGDTYSRLAETVQSATG